MFYIVIILFALPVISILKKSENIAMRNRAIIDKEEADIDEEMIIHQALERAGALPNHHRQEEAIHKRNSKKSSIYYRNLFYILGYFIIAIELWYIYRGISKF